ncbi:MAG: uroporphyrinogen-III synthase [Bowdeniella nasicola]|nr:uroporphyrinogen-III synthase [Bowdeniella nasicola]
MRRAGAEAVAHPFLITHPLDADEDAIRDRLTSGTYTHVALTSARTVETLRARGLIDAIREAGCTVVSVGPATTGAATDAGLDVTHTGERDAESLATDLGPGANHHIWLPCSALAAPTLADRLQAAGWEVTREELYRVEPVPSVDVDLASAWQRGIIDAVLVTSGSVARAIAGLLGHAGPGTAVVTIGEPSARAVRTGGGIVAEVAQSPTPEGLLAACVRALGTQK